MRSLSASGFVTPRFATIPGLLLAVVASGNFWTSSALADEEFESAFSAFEDETLEKPEVIQEDGKPVSLRWSTGHEIILQVSRGKSERLRFRFQVTENSCNGHSLMWCHYELAVKRDVLAMRWAAHPDGDKIGKPVTLEDGDNPVESLSLVGMLDRKLRPERADGLAVDAIECEDFSWLAGTREPPQRFRVASLTSENMGRNGETGVNENMITGGASDVELRRSGPNRMEIDSVGDFLGYDTFSQTLTLLGEVVGLYVTRDRDEACLIAYKPDIGEAAVAFSEFLSRKPEGFETYIHGSDSHYDDSYVQSVVERLAEGSDPEKFQ